MSRQEKRGKTGWWLPALIGLISIAAGIRYLSSTDWWANTFNRDQATYRTINTGASVQVSTAIADDRVPSVEASPGGRQPDRESDTIPIPRRRMW